MFRQVAFVIVIFGCVHGAENPPAIQNVFRLGGAQNGLSICGYGLDSAGNQYLAGNLFASGFSTMGVTRLGPLGEQDLYLAKISPAGDRLLYLIEFGGSGFDQCEAMSVDAKGNV